jgi:hypothetical protein
LLLWGPAPLACRHDRRRLHRQLHARPATFLAAAEPHLALDPVLATVVSSVTHRAIEDDGRGKSTPEHPRWWAVVRDGSGEVVGIAMRTAPFAPYPLFVLPRPDGAALALARALHARGEEVRGVNGALPAARTVADETARLAAGVASVHEHTRLFELGDLVAPAKVPGRLRLAAESDAPLALRWFQAFEADAAEQADRADEGAIAGYLSEDDMRERIAAGRVWFWEDETGEVDGARVCLFTDRANPTSNRIYQAIGFVPVVDMANLVVTRSDSSHGA